MDLLIGKRKEPSTSNRPQQMGMWQCIHNIVKSLITSGYGFSLILVVGFVGFCWVMFGGMNSADKKATLLAFLGWPVISLTGWIVAAITILAAKVTIQLQDVVFQKDYLMHVDI